MIGNHEIGARPERHTLSDSFPQDFQQVFPISIPRVEGAYRCISPPLLCEEEVIPTGWDRRLRGSNECFVHDASQRELGIAEDLDVRSVTDMRHERFELRA